jgi:hypothetical protein
MLDPHMVAHAYNPSTWESEAGGWKVQGQPGLQSETLFKKKKIACITSAIS